MVYNEFKKMTTEQILTTKEERKWGVESIAKLSIMPFEKRVAVLTLIISEHSEFNNIGIGELMNFNMSLFLGFVHNAPNCENKNDFIDDCVGVLMTMKSTQDKSH